MQLIKCEVIMIKSVKKENLSFRSGNHQED